MERVGRYSVTGRVWRSPARELVRADDPRSGREVLIELLERRPEGPDRTRLRDAAAAIAADLRHPGILPVLDAGSSGERDYVVCEFVPGTPLATTIEERAGRGGAFTPAEAVRVVDAVAPALDAARVQGHPFGRLESADVWLAADGRVLLSGAAAVAGARPAVPEHGGREDVRSLAAILDEMLGGETVPTPSAGRQLPGDVVEIIRRALDEVPRHRTAAELAAEFRAALTSASPSEAGTTVVVHTPAPPDLPGRTVKHYRILERLGRGGMGVVYKAEDTRLRRPVALKFLPPESVADPVAKERFVREARAASALDHANICTVYEIGEAESGELFIAMAYYEGVTLRKRLEGAPLPVAEAIDVAEQVARGLAKAHERGIVHRDIKPENVIVTGDGVAKILDFGLAKLVGQATVTGAGVTGGTIAYMSPEQAGGASVDHRSDVWSLGVVLYEMLAGQRPFRGESSASVINAILHREPTPLTSVRAELPEGLSRIVQRALAKEARDRYQSVAEFAADLAAARRPEGAMRVALPARRRWSARRLLWPVAAAIGLAAALALVFHLRAPGSAPRAGEKSLAVLPFASLGGQEGGDYFSDGMTEEIIAQVSRAGDLRVISRTSVMRYKGSTKTLPEIGRELGVATLLEGSVRRAGDRVRVDARLIDARTEKPIWGDSYDRTLTEIFEVQRAVARQIAASLATTLAADEKQGNAKAPTTDLEAYDYYLRGKEYYNRRRRQDNEQALALFEKAIERDPAFALAYTALADAYSQAYYYDRTSDALLASSIAMAQKALTLVPDLAEGHKALGTAYVHKGWTTKAIDSLYQAVRHNPNYAAAMISLGMQLVSVGQLDEGLGWQLKGVAREPTNMSLRAFVGDTYLELADDVRAEAWYREALELQPDLMRARGGLVQLRVLQGRLDDAQRELDQMRSLAPEDPLTAWYGGFVPLVRGDYRGAEEHVERAGNYGALALVYAKTGRAAEAAEMLDSLATSELAFIDAGYEHFGSPYTLAQVLAVKGDREAALHWLGIAVQRGFRRYRWCRLDPMFESVRGDERFGRLLESVEQEVERMRRLADAAGPPG
jgi:serine/threonine protein kinase/TolB-like protein/Flp pilus assembly protein TadD